MTVALRRIALLGLLSLVFPLSMQAAERNAARKEFRIPPQPLDEALLAFSRQAGMELVAVGDFSRAGRSLPISGIMTPESALRRLLGDSAFDYTFERDGMVTVSPSRPPTAAPQRALVNADRPTTVATTDFATLVVSARKRDERLIDVPLAMSAISGERMELLGVENASEAARLTPGVASVDTGSGFTQVQIRGVSSSIGGNDNGYYLDDVAFTGVTVPWHPDTRVFDLDRVEILKGPQGTLFGEGSLGGTIRILTRAPELDRFAARAELGHASTRDGGEGSSVKAMANLPLLRDQLAMRLVVTQEKLPGWIDDPVTGSRDVNGQELRTTRVRMRWSPSDPWLTDVSHASSTSDASGGGYAADDFDQAVTVLGTRSKWQGSSVVSSYQAGNSLFAYLYSESSVDFLVGGELLPEVGFDVGIAVHVRSHELRWSYSIADRLDWQAGYAHRLATRTDRQVVDGVPSMSQQSNRADSLYGEGTLRTLDGAWALTAGLRYFTDHLEALGTVDDTVLVTDSTFSSLNPRLVVAHQFSADHLWYASIASGFRSGQLQPITSLAAAERLGVALPLSIDPDEILSGEIGFKRLLAQRRLLIEGALFQNRWKGLPVRVPLDEANNGIANSKGALIRGAELGVRYSTLSSLSLEFGASVVDAVYVADVPGTPLAKGTRVYNVPKYTGSASVSYAWALGGLTATASVTGLYNSRRATSLTVGSSGDSLFSSSLRMGIQSPRGWALHVYGDNLGDDRGAVDGRNSFGAATRLRPRTFGIEFGFTY